MAEQVPSDRRELPAWQQLPEAEKCGATHPTGAAVCGRGREHGSNWHCDPHARVSWRRYPEETTTARDTG